MFPDINNLLGVEHARDYSHKMVSVCSSNVEGSFFVHHFLSMFVKQGYRVCFVSLAQSFGHYSVVAQKLGVNLRIAREKGQLCVIEGLKMFKTQHYDTVVNKESPSDDTHLFDFVSEKDGSLQSVYKLLKDAFMKTSRPDSCTLLIIDDISVLTSLGAPAKQVMALLHYLRLLVSDGDNPGCLVTSLGNDKDVDDEVNSLVWTWMRHHGDLSVHVYGLDSGFCKEVHGEMTVCWRQTSHTPTQATHRKVMQYRVQDKSISLFAPGTSSAVL